ncbi:MAG TPA: aminopeptidase [Gemmatimonadales bacterium]|nr:aminopeptidase [Gemmatimonadales bacterium]
MSSHARSTGRLALTLAFVALFGCKERNTESGATESPPVKLDDSTPTATKPGEYRSAAEKVVAQSAGVKEGDLVLISGSDEDLPLLEDIAVEVRKRGADPLVRVASLQLGRRLYDEVPAKYDSRVPEMDMKLIGMIDVFIGTEFGEGRTFKGVPAERMVARGKAAAPVAALARKRGVRSVYLGNGLYPSAERAEQFGVSRDQLSGLMYRGIDADYDALKSTGEQVSKVLAGGKELRITNPNGTDFRIGISGRPITVSDGIISADDRKKGGAATSVWLPAGEVFLTPVPGTANGVVVTDEDYLQGQRIEGLRLEFKDGKLTSMTAKAGLEPLKALYDAAGPGKDLPGVIDIGINSGAKAPEGKALRVWSQAGTVTVVVGNNTWAGGDNQVQFAAFASSPKSTLTVDGKPLVQDGKLLAQEKMAGR